MAHTDKCTVLSQYILSKINTAKASLGVDTVLYGDHDKIPPGITVTVYCADKERNLDGVAMPGARTMNIMRVMVTVYNNKTQDEATGRLEVDQKSEAIEHLLHQDTTMGGLIIHGFVARWDPGYRFKSGSLFRAVQMTFAGRTKTNLTDIP